jgi:uncharacterized protein
MTMTERKFEQRSFTTQLRADAASGDRGPRIGGYAAAFNSMSHNLGGFREIIAPGAFTRSLKRGDDVRCLQNHNASLLLGRTKSGTLQLREDQHGLYFTCDLPNTNAARDLHALVQRGDVDECSFGFTCDDEDFSEGTDPDTRQRIQIRTLRSVTLLDVSAVTYPAYPEGTSVSTRSRMTDYVIPAANLAADEYLRRRHALIGAEIAADERRWKHDQELRERMMHAAGRTSGFRRNR